MELAISDWVTTEFLSALYEVSVEARARFTDQHALGLRAGDTLRLAVCADHSATLCTPGRHLGKAKLAVGLTTMLL
jgi:hypothetical protein